MPNWCYNNIAFYQEESGIALLEAFYADIKRYQDFKNENGETSDWVGHWLQENKINTDKIYCRGFIADCELFSDHVLVAMHTAWSPLPEIWSLMAEKYSLSYVYISEESGCEIYVNTDIGGRFFTDRYIINCFDVTDLELDSETEADYGERLRKIGIDTKYYDSFDEVLKTFDGFGFDVRDFEELEGFLDRFGITVYEYSSG